jgi:biopolymer transport protein ExbD
MKGHQTKKVGVKELAQALPLTSLIDAFSIIVIYLLIGTQSGGMETPLHKIDLPLAQNAQTLETEVAVLRIEKNKIYLNDKPVTLANLGEALLQAKNSSKDKKLELLVQADQNLQFAQVDPLVKASSLAGIEKLKFAVIPEK